ncbi:MAG TPA: hypothetical protein VF551_08525 [Chthoniobacterales bacterium]|jgi:hypothetical protein
MKNSSTYSLLVRSEEKGRNLFESAVYSLVVLSTMASLTLFAMQSITLPGETQGDTASSAIAAQANDAAVVAQS